MKKPRIFYHCYDTNVRSGGQKHTYQHVDVLNAHGFDAYALHTDCAKRLTWFRNDTRVIAQAEFERICDPATDYLVLPEGLGSQILDYPCRKVIFNKNAFYGFTAFWGNLTPADPYLHADVVAAFAVSDHNAQHLRFAYPKLNVFRVFSGIDPARFAYRPIECKTRQIALIGKAPKQIATLFHMLRARKAIGANTLDDFKWVLMADLDEEGVARVLQDSLIFVFLNIEEGMPRTLLEALACGCVPVTYAQGPLAECLPPGCGVPYGDVVAAASMLEEIAAAFPHDLAKWRAITEAGRAIAERYSLERQAASVVEAWQQILTNDSLRLTA
jgi:glycosyl transferase family 1